MSHFTNIRTRFSNSFYLKNALSRLEIVHSSLNNFIIIPQPNGSNIEFCWDGHQYELIVDMSFWEQPYPIESFIDKIAQEYATQVIVHESQKIGFQPISYNRNSDDSKILILERWNDK